MAPNTPPWGSNLLAVSSNSNSNIRVRQKIKTALHHLQGKFNFPFLIRSLPRFSRLVWVKMFKPLEKLVSDSTKALSEVPCVLQHTCWAPLTVRTRRHRSGAGDVITTFHGEKQLTTLNKNPFFHSLDSCAHSTLSYYITLDLILFRMDHPRFQWKAHFHLIYSFFHFVNIHWRLITYQSLSW